MPSKEAIKIIENQAAQLALLTTISIASLPDKETPTMLYRVNTGQSFTGAIAGDPILGILVIDTVTNSFVSNTPLWYNGRTKLSLVDAEVDTSKLTIIAANSLTAAELSTLILSTKIDQTTNKVTNGVYPLSTGGEFSSGAIARPANTTPYTAGDVKGATAAAFEITGLGNANQSVRLTKGVILINVAVIPSGMTNFKLKLYSATPVSALTDNAAFTGTGDELIYQGEIVFGNVAVFGGYLRADALELLTDVKLSATGSLFAYIVTVGGYTPTSEATTTTLLTAVGL